MPLSATAPTATHLNPLDDSAALSWSEKRLPALLSVIAGMVDLTGFLTLGNIFTAHITGNLVLVAAVAVRGGPINPAQALAIPVFILAVAAVWLIARASGRNGPDLMRLLLLLQFLLLLGVLVFAVITKASADPHGLMAGIAAMIAVAAMACQFALLRLALPRAPSTAVMTGNLTNAVLALLDWLQHNGPISAGAADRLRSALQLLLGFLAGCIVAAAAVAWLGDWTWGLPVALAGIAALLR